MRASTSARLMLWLLQGCAVSEAANHGTRCGNGASCPLDQACYRDFCVPVEALPALAPDAAAGGTLLPSEDGGPRRADSATGGEPTAAFAGSDAASGSEPLGPEAGMTAMPQADSGLESLPDSSTSGGTASDASVAQGPETDAKAPGGSPLVVCLAYCAVPSPVCVGCVRGVLAVSPSACSARARIDPTVDRMCEQACTTSSPCKDS